MKGATWIRTRTDGKSATPATLGHNLGLMTRSLGTASGEEAGNGDLSTARETEASAVAPSLRGRGCLMPRKVLTCIGQCAIYLPLALSTKPLPWGITPIAGSELEGLHLFVRPRGGTGYRVQEPEELKSPGGIAVNPHR